MTWLYISIIAYFLFGIANLGDKIIVTKYLSSPRVYAISVALLQSFLILLLPFFGEWPGWQNLLLDFAAGAIFVLAIYFLYTALKAGEVSRVIPTIDSLAPIIVLILSFLFLTESLNQSQLIAILFLISGGFLLSYQKEGTHKRVIKYTIATAVCFAIAQILSKIMYSNQPFLSAFILARAGALLAVIPLLFIKQIRQELKNNFTHKDKTSNSKAVLIVQIAGGIGFFLQNYAIKLGDVSVVTALGGVKYLFLFFLIATLSKKFVQLKEDWNLRALLVKIGGVGLIVVGMVLLVL